MALTICFSPCRNKLDSADIGIEFCHPDLCIYNEAGICIERASRHPAGAQVTAYR